MYAERETGGLGRGEIIGAKQAGGTASEGRDSRNRRDQQEITAQPPAAVRLPAKIAVEVASSQARRRSPQMGCWYLRRTHRGRPVFPT